jgi:serine/threonine protein kinase
MSSSILDCSLNDQIYENGNKTIRIYKTRKTGTIKYIAVKVYTKKFHKDKYSYEYNLINKINNEAIVNIMSSSEDNHYFYMEMEYCARGNLSRCLYQNKNNLYNEKNKKIFTPNENNNKHFIFEDQKNLRYSIYGEPMNVVTLEYNLKNN